MSRKRRRSPPLDGLPSAKRRKLSPPQPVEADESVSNFERENELFHEWERQQDLAMRGTDGLAASPPKSTNRRRRRFRSTLDEEDESEFETDRSHHGMVPRTEFAVPRSRTSLEDRGGEVTSSSSSSRSLGRVERRLRDCDLEYETVRSCWLRRDKMISQLRKPYIERMLRGSFARVFLGSNSEDRRVYRLVRIVELVPSAKEYEHRMTVRSRRGGDASRSQRKRYVLRQNMRVTIGKHVRDFALTQASDSPPTQAEFHCWLKNSLETAPDSVPTNAELRRHYETNIKNIAYKHQTTTEDITRRLEEKEKMQLYSDMSHAELERIVMRLQDRRTILLQDTSEGAQQAADEVTDELKEIESQMTKIREVSERRRMVRNANAQEATLRITKINKRNRLRNKEISAAVAAAGAGSEADGSRKKNRELDPFERSETSSSCFWLQGFLRKQRLANGVAPPSQVTPPTPIEETVRRRKERLELKKATEVAVTPTVRALEDAHDFDIDDGILDSLGDDDVGILGSLDV